MSVGEPIAVYPTGLATPGASSNLNAGAVGQTLPRRSPDHSKPSTSSTPLAVGPENLLFDYNRNFFPHWATGPGGCDTRAQVLIRDSLSPAQVDPFGCAVVAGDWLFFHLRRMRQRTGPPPRSCADCPGSIPLARMATALRKRFTTTGA